MGDTDGTKPPPKTGASPVETPTGILRAARKLLDDVKLDEKLNRTKETTRKLSTRIGGKARDLSKETSSTLSKAVGCVRAATRRTTHRIAENAIQFLEGVEQKTRDAATAPQSKRPSKPAARKRPKSAPASPKTVPAKKTTRAAPVKPKNKDRQTPRKAASKGSSKKTATTPRKRGGVPKAE